MKSTSDRWLDRSVVFSFDRTGYRRHARSFAPSAPRDLTHQNVLITGGTAGIGFSAAKTLAGLGARPILWARDAERGQAAAQQVNGLFTSVDLGDLRSVSAAAHALETEGLAVVLLNAGAMPLERRLTSQDHELIWASQVLGHTLLLRVLFGRGLLTDRTRVVWVSSGGMYTQQLDLRDLRCDSSYKRHSVYANAKRAQLVLNTHLATRWPGVHTSAMHPGWVDTEAVKHSMPWFRAITAPILRSPAEGADTMVWLSSAQQTGASGRFWFDREEVPEHLSARTKSRAGDEEALIQQVFSHTEPFLEAP